MKCVHKYIIFLFMGYIFLFSSIQAQSPYYLGAGIHSGVLPMGSTPSFSEIGIATGFHGLVTYRVNDNISIQSGMFFSSQRLTFLNDFNIDISQLIQLNIPLIFSYKLTRMYQWTIAADVGLDWNNNITQYDLDQNFLPIPGSEHIKLLSSNVVDNSYRFNFGSRLGFNIVRKLKSDNYINIFCHYLLPIRNTEFLYYQMTRFPESTKFTTTRNYLNLSYHGIQLGASYMFQLKKE